MLLWTRVGRGTFVSTLGVVLFLASLFTSQALASRKARSVPSQSAASLRGFQSDPQGNVPASLDSFGAQHFPSTYGGVVEIESGRHLNVYLTSLSASVEAALRTHAPRGDLTFVQTAHSAAYAAALHQRLTAQSTSLQERGINLVEWWPDIPAGREMIGVEYITASQTFALDSRFGASNVQIFNVLPSQAPIPTAGRAFDSPPWKGGDYIAAAVGNGVVGCSSGFGVTINGASRLLTAAHCFGSGNLLTNFNITGSGSGSGSFIGPVGEVLTASGDTDAESIQASGSDQIYLNGAHTTSLATIVGESSNPVGADVFDDGAYSGETFALRITDRDICYKLAGHRNFCGGVRAVGRVGEIANQLGDSGGPMIRIVSGRVYAAGIVSGTTGGTVSCVVNTPDKCFTDVFYSNIESVTSQLHARLMTG